MGFCKTDQHSGWPSEPNTDFYSFPPGTGAWLTLHPRVGHTSVVPNVLTVCLVGGKTEGPFVFRS